MTSGLMWNSLGEGTEPSGMEGEDGERDRSFFQQLCQNMGTVLPC